MTAYSLSPKIELLLAGVWTDITHYVMSRDQPTNVIQITRGRRNEGTTADPASCSLQLNNRDGRFSPRNPSGPYYGVIGRNTQLRVSVPGSAYLIVASTTTDYCDTPDSAALSITGDFEFHADMFLASWATGAERHLCGKWMSTGNQQSWALNIGASGNLVLYTSADGTTVITHTSTVPVPQPWIGRKCVNINFQANNGAGGHTVRFYTADYEGAAWVQLGGDVVTAGTTAIFDSTASLQVGSVGATRIAAHAYYYSATLYNGIAGPVVASPVFYVQTANAATFADAQGNTWTPHGASLADDRRFYGEVSEWPQQWDTTVTDRYVPIQASGILRRLGARKTLLKSAYFRGCTSKVAPVTSLVGYWPMEEPTGATTLAGYSGGSPMVWTGTPVLASDSTSFICSSALPNVGTATFVANMSPPAGATAAQARCLIAVPAAGTTNGSILLRIECQGTAFRWDVVYNTGGSVTLNAYNSSGTLLVSDGPWGFGLDGTRKRFGLAVTNNGAGGVYYSMSTLDVGATVGLTGSGTLASNSVGSFYRVVLNQGGNATNTTMGHLTAQSAMTSVYELSDLLNAYSGDLPQVRLSRLCAEEGISFLSWGSSSSPMGYQLSKTLIDLLRECELTDQGFLYEAREYFGLGYQTRESMYSQPSSLDLSFTGGDLSAFTPIEDDQTTVNQVTTTRVGGSSAVATLGWGPLSTLDPPSGVGLYDQAYQVSLATDTQPALDAAWRLALGTVNESRYPAIGLQLSRGAFAASAMRTSQARRLDIGDRVVVSSFPTGFPPDPVEQLVVGFSETLGQFAQDITAVGVPASPYRVATYDRSDSRYDSGYSSTNGLTTSGATTLHCWNRDKIPWTHADGDFDIIVAGERMTVTGVATDGVPFNPLNANPTFDAGITDWYSPTGSTIAAEAGTVHAGAGSLKLTTVAVADNRVECNAFLVKVGGDQVVGNFAVQGWLRCTSAIQVSVRINWYDSTLTYISSTVAGSVVVANTWTSFGWGVDAPAGVVYANCGAGVDGSPGAGIVLYVDDLTLCRYSMVQSLTVTRAVNGVVKAHGDNEEIHLFRPVHYAL